MIAGKTCVNRKGTMRKCKQFTLVDPEMHRCFEIYIHRYPQSNGHYQSSCLKKFGQTWRVATRSRPGVGQQPTSVTASSRCLTQKRFSQLWRSAIECRLGLGTAYCSNSQQSSKASSHHKPAVLGLGVPQKCKRPPGEDRLRMSWQKRKDLWLRIWVRHSVAKKKSKVKRRV